jgi:hypothetical protein
LPTAVMPITGDIDAEVRRLESIALTGIEPRLTNLRIRPVPVTRRRAEGSDIPLTAASSA